MATVGSKTFVEVGGVDVTSFTQEWLTTERLTVLIDVGTIVFNGDIENTLPLLNEAAVVIKRGKITGSESVIFRGFIKLKRSVGINTEVDCEGKIGQAARRQVTNTYDINNDVQAGVLSAMVEDIMESFAGLAFTVTDSSTYSAALKVFPCNRDFCLERSDVLREVLDWVIRWDYDLDNGVFEPKGNVLHPAVFRHDLTGTTNVHNNPIWESDSATLVNEVEVVGSSQDENTTQTFSASASQTVFTLAATPGQTEVTVDGTAKVLGILDSTETFDYSVAQHLKEVTFEVAMTGGEAVVIKYGNLKPVSFTVQDADSIDSFSPVDDLTGAKLPLQRTFKFQDVRTVADAEVRADELLAHFKDPLLNTILDIDQQTTTVRAGMALHMVDTVEGIDENFIVTEVVHRWPDPTDVVNIGQERVYERTTLLAIDDRLRKVERRELANVDQINLRRDIEKFIRFYGNILIFRRNTEFDGEWGRGFGDGVASNTLNWGESGALWQNTFTNANVLFSVVWSDNISEEDFTDDELIDEATMTGTLDTSAGTIVLAAGENAILGPTHKNISGTQASPTNINSVKIKMLSAQLTGVLDTVEVKSSNAGSYETVVGDITLDDGITHTFSVAGPEVFVRLTSTAGATLSGKDAVSNKIVTAFSTEVIT